jgi:hypothetical protein
MAARLRLHLVRPATTSNLPAMIKKLRHDTGLPGRHTD